MTITPNKKASLVSQLWLVVLAGALVLSLSACGGAATTEEASPTTQEQTLESTDSTEATASEEEAESLHELEYGHLHFSDPNANYELLTSAEELETIINQAAIPDENLEPYCVLLTAGTRDSSKGYGLVLRTKEGTEITQELVETIFMGLIGRDTHAEMSLSDGATLYYTYQLTGLANIIVIDEYESTLWVSVLTSPDTQQLINQFEIDGAVTMDELMAESSTETQRIGKAELAYVDVPANWVPFSDVDNSEVYQYASPSGHDIITLDVYTAEEFGLTGDQVENLAPLIAQSFVERYQSSEDVSEYETYSDTVGGLDAYLLISHWSDGTDLYTFVVDGEGIAYYIAVEGDPSVAYNVAMLARSTFSTQE